MIFELLATRATYAPGEPVAVEVRGLPAPGTLRVLHLGDLVLECKLDRDATIEFGLLPAGGYGLQAHAGDTVARTAVEVRGTGPAPMRYGFVSDYRPGRDPAAVAENVRRLHLTDVQFYDWAYRHADLLGGGEDYHDALGQPISLRTVRQLISSVRAVGARALGYAAVYGVGNEEWARWRYAALLRPCGEPYRLGDFLRLVDPAEAGWSAHLAGQLRAAAEQVGFDGFHLDQYGYPKHAVRPDGTAITVEDSFTTLIAAARAALPAGRLVFNNVNDFPTWRTGPTAQDAVYVEIWPPHVTLGHLAAVATRAQAAGAGKPVVLAAYQHVYDCAPALEADLATSFTMATLFSHGAGQLLAGEADRILVDPYYVTNHTVEASTAALLRRWYDFDVEHGELLHDPDAHDVTGSLAGDYNGDCDVTYPATGGAVRVTETATAHAVWRRIVGTRTRLIVHLINLTGQVNTEWDAPRKPVGELSGGILRVRRAAPARPRIRVADPDRQPALRDVEVRLDGDYAVAELPPLYTWQLILIDLADPVGSLPHPAPKEPA